MTTESDRSLTPEERRYDFARKALNDCGEAFTVKIYEALTLRTFIDAADVLRSASREPEARSPWIVSPHASDGAQPWCIGIQNKGPREWFDTREDAERAVKLLNAATLASGEPAPREPGEPGSLTIREVP